MIIEISRVVMHVLTKQSIYKFMLRKTVISTKRFSVDISKTATQSFCQIIINENV